MIPAIALVSAIGLAVVHVVASWLRFLDVIPRSRWLSAAGGVSVAYVFVHLLPELSRGQAAIAAQAGQALAFLEFHAYLMALLGLAVFYGLERAAKISRARQRATKHQDVTSPRVFWLHMTSYGLYNALIGYVLLHREAPGLRSLVTFAVAIALHFMVNDYGLRHDHKQLYTSTGRWLLASAVLAGWATGLLIEITPAALALLLAFLAGGVILNVLKEELPEERESRFWPFALGALGYTIVLLAS